MDLPYINCSVVFPAYLCDSLSSIANGAISYNPDGLSPYNFGTVALYTCNEGFVRTGSPVRTCLGAGSNTTGYWDSSPPACIGKHTHHWRLGGLKTKV